MTQIWLLLGSPGAGQSMLARRLTTLLSMMTVAEALEPTRLHRVAAPAWGEVSTEGLLVPPYLGCPSLA